MKRCRVAVTGCRARGSAITRGYAAHPRTEVAVLCDLQPELADTLGEEPGVAARCGDLDRMMGEARPAIVVVATGTEFHYDLCRRVLEYGAHLDVEKPICPDPAQADALPARACARGTRIAAHHQARVRATLRAVRKAITGGRIGEVRQLLGSGKGYYGGRVAILRERRDHPLLRRRVGIGPRIARLRRVAGC